MRSARDVRSLHGSALLDGLTALPSAALRAAVREDGPVQTTILDDPPTAVESAGWWSSLSDGDRTRMLDDAPQVVGTLEGIPYAVRDTANREYLRRAVRAAHRDVGTPGAMTTMLGQIDASLDEQPGDPPKTLLTVDLRGTGRVAIAIGDLDTARDVTVLVPGMFFTVTGQLADWTDTAVDLYQEQATLSPVASVAPASTGRVGEGSGIAVIAWMGYHTPDLSSVMSLRLAHEGAPRLERVVTGLDMMRAATPPRVSVVAHSYGSTTSLIALATGRIHVDSLTVIGSPGSTVAHADQLAVPTGQVFVGNAKWDPIAGTGYFGTDPGSRSFGSRVLDLDGGPDWAADGDVFRRPRGHNDYLKPGTASLHDIALIVIGRSDLVPDRTRIPGGAGGHDGNGPGSPDFLVVRPQDLLVRD
ncbi:alpha/beta hydrolase [Curtobacterium sp. RRHDQ10]|uniref:alpha/beta hydrolase n=1 Tax=Curtobacterium phyllosphaerae TaxID=3413379 RepID=UPI003BEFEAE3